jgi:hypothetical protein
MGVIVLQVSGHRLIPPVIPSDELERQEVPAMIKRIWKRFAGWWGSGGSGSGPSSAGYDEARFRSDISRGHDGIGPTG